MWWSTGTGVWVIWKPILLYIIKTIKIWECTTVDLSVDKVYSEKKSSRNYQVWLVKLMVPQLKHEFLLFFLQAHLPILFLFKSSLKKMFTWKISRHTGSAAWLNPSCHSLGLSPLSNRSINTHLSTHSHVIKQQWPHVPRQMAAGCAEAK